jgi:hypothetical protein
MNTIAVLYPKRRLMNQRRGDPLYCSASLLAGLNSPSTVSATVKHRSASIAMRWSRPVGQLGSFGCNQRRCIRRKMPPLRRLLEKLRQPGRYGTCGHRGRHVDRNMVSGRGSGRPAGNTRLHLGETCQRVRPAKPDGMARRGTRRVASADGARPPYSPELNPMEDVWDYLRQNKLCAAVWDSYDAIVDACTTAWYWLIADPARITSLGTHEWACVSH